MDQFVLLESKRVVKLKVTLVAGKVFAGVSQFMTVQIPDGQKSLGTLFTNKGSLAGLLKLMALHVVHQVLALVEPFVAQRARELFGHALRKVEQHVSLVEVRVHPEVGAALRAEGVVLPLVVLEVLVEGRLVDKLLAALVAPVRTFPGVYHQVLLQAVNVDKRLVTLLAHVRLDTYNTINNKRATPK